MAKHIGSTLDEFFEEKDLLAEAEAVAVKRVITFQLKDYGEGTAPFKDRTGKTDENQSRLAGAIARSRKCFGYLVDLGSGSQGAGHEDQN